MAILHRLRAWTGARTSHAHEHDPDFDPLERRPRGFRADAGLAAYQRLVANPFLALTALTFWFAFIRDAVRARRLEVFLIGLGFLPPGLLLLQYHCLDCGKTGVLWRWRRHACARVAARVSLGRPRSFRGPSPTTQGVLWLYLIGLAAIAGLVFHWR